MLGYWLAAGSPHYPEMTANQHIAYISDLGATFLKPLFITGSAVMVVVFDATFILERWFRHKNRLMPNYSRKEALLSICAILAAIAGAVGLILLTIFDIRQYDRMHDICLGVFMYVMHAVNPVNTLILTNPSALATLYQQYSSVLNIKGSESISENKESCEYRSGSSLPSYSSNWAWS